MRPSTGSPRSIIAGSGSWPARASPTGFCPTTSDSPTPSFPGVPPPSHDDNDSQPWLLRPSTGDRNRTALVPDAVVAGDVRVGVVEAVRGLPGGGRGRIRQWAAGEGIGLPDLLALRPGLAFDEHRGRPGRTPAWSREDA